MLIMRVSVQFSVQYVSTSESVWDHGDFGNITDEIYSKDSQLAGIEKGSLHLKRSLRPYMVTAGFEEDIKFIFSMNHPMCSLLVESEFIDTDITYNEHRYR